MKIFSAAQIRACDAYTVHASSIASVDLMERAAAACTEWISANYPKDSLFIVLCGSGNNGGDGLAITRMLHALGYGVKAFLLPLTETLSPDCHTNLQRLLNEDPAILSILQQDSFITDIPATVVIIDALLGTGLSRPAEGWVAQFISHINQLDNKKVAIDLPSGLPADSMPEADAAIIRADDTLSFQFYKRSFLHPETGVYAGNIHLLPIGLDETFIHSTPSNYQVIDRALAKSIYRPRDPFAHKGSLGTAMLIGGSYGMMGSICLSARAANRSGAGLIRGLVPETGYQIFQQLVPEATCMTNGEKFISRITGWENADSIGIGPGLSTESGTGYGFETFLETCKQPVVFDADALNLIGKKPELLHKIPAGSILTPHPKEFERVFGKTANSMLRLEHARTQAMRYNIIIVLKGRHTAVVTPEGECWYNVAGNAGMATGGSGDVLTGIITSLMAQQYDGVDSALLGVYLHGLAGDFAAEKLSQEAMTASDIIEQLGAAFRALG